MNANTKSFVKLKTHQMHGKGLESILKSSKTEMVDKKYSLCSILHGEIWG